MMTGTSETTDRTCARSSRNRARRMKAARAKARIAVEAREDAIRAITTALAALAADGSPAVAPTEHSANGPENAPEPIPGGLMDNPYSKGAAVAIQAIEGRIELLEDRAKSLSGDSAEASDRLAEAERLLGETRAEAGRLREENASLAAAADRAAAERDAEREEARLESAARAAAEERAAGLEEEARGLRSAAAETAAETQASLDEAARLGALLAESRSEVDRLRNDAAAAAAREAASCTERFDLKARLQEAVDQLAARGGELVRVRDELERAQGALPLLAESEKRIAGLADELAATRRDRDAARERGEALSSRLSSVREEWLPKPPSIRFGDRRTLLVGSGFQEITVRELLYKQDGSVWAGDGSANYARVGATAQWDGGQI